MKKLLCALLALCLFTGAALAEDIVSADVEAQVPEAWTAGEDNGLWVEGEDAPLEGDFTAWEAEDDAPGVSAAEDGEPVAINPFGDEAVPEQPELELTPDMDAADAPIEYADPVVDWTEAPDTFIWDGPDDAEDDRDSEALFAAYARGILYGKGKTVLMATNNAGRNLTGLERLFYTAMKEMGVQVAAGNRASTTVEIPMVELLGKSEFTAAELGVTMEYDADGRPTQASKEALIEAYRAMIEIDMPRIRQALWSDCPYEMFWYDRQGGIYRSFPGYWYAYDVDRQDTVLTIKEGSCYSVFMSVTNEFAGSEEYTVNTALLSKTRQAAANARAIVDMYDGCSDYAKLYGYAVEICKRVKYNTPAIQDDWDKTNQNPWRLIWVFDNDLSTDVVCEGYAAAFSYLCELSSFGSGVRCFTVDGDAGGAHAWNVVRMDNGKNYVVDVTWMDGGWADSLPFNQPVTASQVSTLLGGSWFLVGGSGSVSDGYTIETRNGSSSFRSYFDRTLAANPASVLKLADRRYVMNGFQIIHGDTYFFEDGSYVTGEFGFDAKRYIAGDDGVVDVDWYYTGWKTLDGKYYFFDENGLHTKHTVVVDEAVPATCTEKGKTEGKHCSVCDAVLVEQDELAPLGHLWGATKYTLSEDGKTMTATRACVHDAEHMQTETVRTTARVTREATCTEVGETTYTATFTNPAFVKQTRVLKDIPATGHRWGEPAYEWTGNSSVKATRVCLNDPDHTEWENRYTSAAVTKLPTCTEKGETTYTATFTNAAFKAQSRTLADVPARGHNWGTPRYAWANDASSVTASRLCRNDHNHIETETVKTSAAVSQAPTCTVMGWTAYTAAFSNPAFTAQSARLQNIPATGHRWGEPTYAWTEKHDYVTASRSCLNDASHTQTETVKTLVTASKLPTCTEKGDSTYTATFKNSAFATQSVTRAGNIAALGHKWGNPSYLWSDDGATVTASRICTHMILDVPSSHVEEETVAVTAAVAKAPTCTEMGCTAYTATFAEQKRMYQDIPATGHSPVTDEAVAATYTKTGLTAGSHCAVCGQVLTPQLVVAKKPRTSLAKAVVTAGNKTYTGKALTTTVTVTYGKKTLVEGKHYTVTGYADNVKVGTATVTVKGKGKYTGTVKVTFKIKPKKVTGLKLKAGSKKLTATWKKVSGASGYQLQYATSTKKLSTAAKITVKGGKTVKYTIKKLKAKKTYYVRIRSYRTVNGKKYYSSWSGPVKKKTR